jgi:coatomer subunit gamma
MGNTV